MGTLVAMAWLGSRMDNLCMTYFLGKITVYAFKHQIQIEDETHFLLLKRFFVDIYKNEFNHIKIISIYQKKMYSKY